MTHATRVEIPYGGRGRGRLVGTAGYVRSARDNDLMRTEDQLTEHRATMPCGLLHGLLQDRSRGAGFGDYRVRITDFNPYGRKP